MSDVTVDHIMDQLNIGWLDPIHRRRVGELIAECQAVFASSGADSGTERYRLALLLAISRAYVAERDGREPQFIYPDVEVLLSPAVIEGRA